MHLVEDNALFCVLINLWYKRLSFRWKVKELGWLSQENLVNKKCLSLIEVIPYLRAANCVSEVNSWEKLAEKLKALKSRLGPVRFHYIFVSDAAYFGILSYLEYSSSLGVCLSNLKILVLVWFTGRLIILHMVALQKWYLQSSKYLLTLIEYCSS